MLTWPDLLSADEARRRFDAAWTPVPRTERIPTPEALGRILAAAIASPEDLPPFRRSLMDGFACRAGDVAALPARLRLVDDVQMGERAQVPIGQGEAARVPTGGMLPEGTELVVPIEYATADAETVTVESAPPQGWTAGRHLIERGEDVTVGEPLLAVGRRLRPPDLGALMGLGITEVEVYAPPLVGIIATGDEVTPDGVTPPFGKIRDMNSYSLSGYVQSVGGIPRRYGVVRDDAAVLAEIAGQALAECDVLLFSAGTSVGEKDVVAKVIDGLGQPGVLVHGVDIRPGKPTVFAVCNGKAVFGLPGQPVSVLNTFDQFVAPALRRLLGDPEKPRTLRARLTAPIRSADGREDHVRVSLEERGGEWLATPIPGVSAMITTMVRADGMTVIPSRAPGHEAGELVEVRLIG